MFILCVYVLPSDECKCDISLQDSGDMRSLLSFALQCRIVTPGPAVVANNARYYCLCLQPKCIRMTSYFTELTGQHDQQKQEQNNSVPKTGT